MSEDKRLVLAESSLLLGEAVKYKIFPRFKTLFSKHGDTKKLEKLMEAVEDYRDADGEQLYAERNKIVTTVLLILKWIVDLYSVVMLPFCIFIIPILYLMFYRLLRYAIDKGEVAVAVSDAKKVISQLKALRNKTADAKLKAKLDEDIKKLQDAIEEAREGEDGDK